MRRRDAGLSGIQAYRPLSITLHQRRARTLPPCPRLEWKPNNERGSERREDFDPAFPGRSIQDCDSRYHILRTNVNTKFRNGGIARIRAPPSSFRSIDLRSEEHTSELQSRFDLVCRLLLEKKKKHI